MNPLDGHKKLLALAGGSAGLAGVPDKLLPYYTAIFVAYLLGQAAVDAAKAWRK